MLNKLFVSLEKEQVATITYRVPPIWIVTPLEENMSLGKQIKHYRRLANIKQKDLSLKLGYTKQALHHLENQEIKLVDVNLIKGIINELNLEDKIVIDDDYIQFLLGNPCEIIKNIRKSKNMSLQQFGNLIGVSDTSIRRWEHGNNHISREMYNRLKKCME